MTRNIHETDGCKHQLRYEPFSAKAQSRRSSRLNQWPCQIDMLPDNAPYLDGADILIAADCSAFAYGDFHNEFIKDRITVIGCPRHDSSVYTLKLAGLLSSSDIKSITVVRMDVGCCDGIEKAVVSAVRQCGKDIPLSITTITTDGRIL